MGTLGALIGREVVIGRAEIMTPSKLISGAQTGADRAALDWAIFRDIPHGS